MQKLSAKKGFTLVEIMVVVAIIAIIAAIALPNLLRSRVGANEAIAKKTLKTISDAAESFSTDNNGRYPTQMSDLLEPVAHPPYLNEDYCVYGFANPRYGYIYGCNWNQGGVGGGYHLAALPAKPGVTGTFNYTITTGGVWNITTWTPSPPEGGGDDEPSCPCGTDRQGKCRPCGDEG